MTNALTLLQIIFNNPVYPFRRFFIRFDFTLAPCLSLSESKCMALPVCQTPCLNMTPSYGQSSNPQ